MEVGITKKQMKEMIIKHYKELGGFNLRVKIYKEKKMTSILARNFKEKESPYYPVITIKVFGELNNGGIAHEFSEEISKEKLDAIVMENFDSEKYDISKIDFDSGVRFSLFATDSVAPYFKGLVVKMNKKKRVGKYIVKK